MAVQPGEVQRIVVGADGSPSADEALAWAVRQAQLTGATVDAVIAWEYPVSIGGVGLAPVGMYDDTDFSKLAEDTVAKAIARANPAAYGVTVHARVAEGNAAEALLTAADGASLLVVGSRGHGGFVSALLGSVSQHCVHHASCPVVVIRGREHV
jgi:nucleotide-binding universal stress UspA family protein